MEPSRSAESGAEPAVRTDGEGLCLCRRRPLTSRLAENPNYFAEERAVTFPIAAFGNTPKEVHVFCLAIAKKRKSSAPKGHKIGNILPGDQSRRNRK